MSEDCDIPIKTEKKQNTLAVFEHIKHKAKKHKIPPYRRSVIKRLALHDSDNDLSQEEEDPPGPQKKRFKGVRLLIEPMKLICLWNDCESIFTDYHDFIQHIIIHISYIVDANNTWEIFNCDWDSCRTQVSSIFLLKQHVVFHGYHSRLINVGNNVLERASLPKCLLNYKADIPVDCDGYRCEWEDCIFTFSNIYDFYEHIRVHVNSNPKYCKKGEIILCYWKGCKHRFNTQYKLADHLKTHTKERSIACPTCGTMFTTKTKFQDHRKRQLPLELKSYQCSQCSKLFPSERLLCDHIRSHINLYKCTMCDMTCAKPSALRAHIRYRHLLDRPLKCNLCAQACVTKQAMEKHLLTHNPDNLLACGDCDFQCRSMHGLERHYQTAHGQGWSKTYGCHCCKKKFPLGNRLTKHLMKDHDFRWPSGHSRFRYKEDPDGIFRLQTVRYESIEVTQEIIRTNISDRAKASFLTENKPVEETAPKYVLKFEENGAKNVVCPTANTIVISINDVDEKGNIVNSQTVQSNEMKILTHSV